MSSRNTFITNYIYSEDATAAIAEALRKFTDYVTDGKRFVCGVIKGHMWDLDLEKQNIFCTVDAAARSVGYESPVDIVIIGDDEPGVISRNIDFFK